MIFPGSGEPLSGHGRVSEIGTRTGLRIKTLRKMIEGIIEDWKASKGSNFAQMTWIFLGRHGGYTGRMVDGGWFGAAGVLKKYPGGM
jgi:hypothetical protein